VEIVRKLRINVEAHHQDEKMGYERHRGASIPDQRGG
jgi:hypothetical protein